MTKKITIRGARQHNLKNISLEIPKEKFVVITGLSGSGKSTLAFDTLYAEGQRRYVESLSSYARQFLGIMDKPDVESIDGLSPAISIEQKTTSKNPRSTVGTVTEIYDYLRLLFARIATPYCPVHNEPIIPQTKEDLLKLIKKDFSGDVLLMSPIIRDKKGLHQQIIKDLNKEGFSRVRINGEIKRTDDKIDLSRYKKHNIDLIVDRFDIKDNLRLSDAIDLAKEKSDGLIIVSDRKKEKKYSLNLTCPKCSISFEELQPRMFSFNSPFGACENCHGLGIKIEFDKDLIIPDKTKSIIDGAIACYPKQESSWRLSQIKAAADEYGFDIFTPIKDFSKKHLDILLYGTGDIIYKTDRFGRKKKLTHGWEGIIPQQERLLRETSSDYRKKELEKFMISSTCPECNGKRLKKKILSAKINSKSIIDITDMPISKALEFFKNIKLTKKEKTIANQILKEINSRLEFLQNVGLGYISLSRSSKTLSGGEAQRIRLATQIGSNLTGVLYVLDEPSIGLHQRDNDKLISTLKNLRDLGNTLVVVEHDEDTILAADHIVDMGPGAGVHGGEIVASGTPDEIKKSKESLTGRYLRGEDEISVRTNPRDSDILIKVAQAEENNLKKIDVEFKAGCLNLVTGVSGSGKSTLVNEVFYKGFLKKLKKSKEKPGKHKGIYTDAYIDKIIQIDQSPIGKTPRSNPATYIGVFDEIRKVFSETKESKIRGYSQGRFSFNIPGGRCEKCKGDGSIKIEMNFLPDVYVQCEECKGTRYNRETLDIKYKGKNISEVLDMSVEEALEHFKFKNSIKNKLNLLVKVGLGYIKLGQSSTTLSGGESQRIKLTKELAKRSTGRTIYILDEPTTGLHFHDVKNLLDVINNLVDKGNTVIIIEHNLDVIKSADYVIDLGPEGGDGGGEIIATGTPEDISKNKNSWTGKYLKKFFQNNKP